MKTSYSFIRPMIFLFILSNIINSQIIMENFNYNAGNLIYVTSNWTEFQHGTYDVEVIDGNLTYSNYALSNCGRMISLNGGLGSRSGVVRNFTAQKNNGVSVYYSFLLNVINSSDLDINTSNGDNFVNFVSSVGSRRSFIFIRLGSDPSKFCLGLAKANSDDLKWYTTDLNINTTYLIVIRYYFQSGNDITRLWINPNLLGSEPTPNLELSSGSDAQDIYGIEFTQRTKSGHEQIDGLQITKSWAQIPLPVKLTSFSAILSVDYVLLSWKTATEINNYGFEVERRQASDLPDVASVKSQTQQTWDKIGFIPGNGNSNSLKNYSFVDSHPPVGKVQYRLKQIDYDGNFEYSNSLEIIINTPSKSESLQNYPNPFNPSTTISYNLQVSSHTTIKVFDLLGKEVAILVNEEKPAGKYEIVWNGKDKSGKKLSSGVYIYKLIAGTFMQTRKMILLN